MALALPPGERPFVVSARFDLRNINEIDDEAETFEFTGVLTFTWRDRRQAFDSDEAGVDERIYQGSYQFNELAPAWFPQVVLSNESGLYEKDAVLLRVAPDGTCTLIETVNAIAETSLNLRRYPFDSQRLEAVFEILGFGADEVVLHAEPKHHSPANARTRIPQWRITGLSAEVGTGLNGSASALVIGINVQRQSLFTLRLVVLPLTLIVLLSWSVFWMDQSALGDRMSVSFVGVLTAVAYQVVIGETLPQISYVTLINGFLNLSFVAMCATVLVNLRVGVLDKRGETERGDRIDRISRRMFPMVYFGLNALFIAIAFLVF